MKLLMFLILQTNKKMHVISLQDSGESGEKVQDEITTSKYLVTRTMLVDTTVHPGF